MPHFHRQWRYAAWGISAALSVVWMASLGATLYLSNITDRTDQSSLLRIKSRSLCQDSYSGRLPPWCGASAMSAKEPLTRLVWTPHLYRTIDSSLLYTSLPEYTGRRVHFKKLAQDIGFVHTIRLESTCQNCSQTDSRLLSHLQALARVSREAHDRYVIYLADNVELAAQITNRTQFLSTLDDELQRHLTASKSADFFYLGVGLTLETRSCTPYSCTPASGLHACMVTPRGALRILHSLHVKYGNRDEDDGHLQLEDYVRQHIVLTETIGPSPVLGWDFTHDDVIGGWRGLFYPSPSFKVVVGHEPRMDLLGSFVTPTICLLAIANYHGWTLNIIPFAGSIQEVNLMQLVGMRDTLDKGWGSGFQDASNRADFNPIQLNTVSYDALGIFPPVLEIYASLAIPWIRTSIPQTESELFKVCREAHQRGDDCHLLFPDDPAPMIDYMHQLGSDKFFTPEFRQRTRDLFLRHNAHRLTHYNASPTGHSNPPYHVAMHVRRGDILDPDRWMDQSVYAALARAICATRANAHIHVFSAGKNRDGDWTTLEALTKVGTSVNGTAIAKCASVSFHLDELEFDSWAHMVAADAMIMSKSTFGLIPSLLSGGEVYYPKDYWMLRLPSFRLFDSQTGEIVLS